MMKFDRPWLIKKTMEFWINDFYGCVFFVDILHNCMYVNAFGVAFLDTSSLGGKCVFYLMDYNFG